MPHPPTYDELKQMVTRLKARLSEYDDELKKLQINTGQHAAENREKFQQMFNHASEAIFIAQDDVLKYSNPKTWELVGYTADELKSNPFINMIHPADRQLVYERYRKGISGEIFDSTYSFRILNKGGEEIWVQQNAALTSWEGKPATINFLKNITRQKKLERQLLQSRKMEAIGTLAGGIAHAFNNLLMGIGGRAALAMMDIEPTSPAHEQVRGIEKLVKVAGDLTSQLLGFARGGKYQSKQMDINKLVEETAEMFFRAKKEISIRTKLAPHLWRVEADQSQMEQVLLSLYANAWQAIPQKGTICIETENIFLAADIQEPYRINSGSYVKISVIDNGIGMDQQTQERIFEPFFTTKEIGAGTGLGLSSVYGIIKNHRGHIDVKSKRGQGTTLSIFLPAIETKKPREVALVKPTGTHPETVLIIDDEKIILNIGQQLLEKLGYRTLTADSGEAGVEIFRQKRDRIDLVILDMIMPDMEGRQVYYELKQIDPMIKVLISSGYGFDGAVKELLQNSTDAFIQKPFGMRELSHKLRQLLDRSTARSRIS